MLIDSLRREAHLWLTKPESVQDEEILRGLEATLSEGELGRYRRFRFPEDRRRYLVSHALVRRVLSKYVDIKPTEWIFSHSMYGRPEIANIDAPALRFNLTHTTGLSACVVTLSQECGADAEHIDARHNLLGVAERMFSRSEFEALQQLQGQKSLEYFFSRWTLREAYVKALGRGLSYPTRQLTFTVSGTDTIEMLSSSDIERDKEHWQFELFRPTSEHVAAVAIRRDDQTSKKVVMRFVNLHEVQADT